MFGGNSDISRHVTVYYNVANHFSPKSINCFTTMDSDPGFITAVQEAKAGFGEGGVPIGACLVSKEGEILGKGHNMRVQKGSATLHVGLSRIEARCEL